ncbi:MAG: hypothetical protein L7U52_08050, partial [Alphaproteobacteria bacterium]|nr:hypothetical protein [Alphaproteobacteria bacterium]
SRTYPLEPCIDYRQLWRAYILLLPTNMSEASQKWSDVALAKGGKKRGNHKHLKKATTRRQRGAPLSYCNSNA